MKRKDLIKKHLIGIINNCDMEDLYSLLTDFRETKIMYGYAVATLLSFEDNKIGKKSNEELLPTVESEEYFRMFIEWLQEEL